MVMPEPLVLGNNYNNNNNNNKWFNYNAVMT